MKKENLIIQNKFNLAKILFFKAIKINPNAFVGMYQFWVRKIKKI